MYSVEYISSIMKADSQKAMVGARYATLKHGSNRFSKVEGEKSPSTNVRMAYVSRSCCILTAAFSTDGTATGLA
jgi:hypothetical protein